jgi:hypothetical protein
VDKRHGAGPRDRPVGLPLGRLRHDPGGPHQGV